MKNQSLIWLVAALMVMAMSAFATPVSENFDGLTTGSSYTTVDYNGFHLVNVIVNTQGATACVNPLPDNAVRLRDAANPDVNNQPYVEFIGSDGNGKDGGVGVITMNYKSWDGNPVSQYAISMSVNGGAYTVLDTVTSDQCATYQTYNRTINNSSDNIKVRIQRITGERLHLDFFGLTDYSGGADITPPAITTIDVISHTTVDVHFTETVTLATSQVAANYTVDNGVGHPLSATRTDTSTVRLVFNTLAGNSYVLSADNVMDAAGNTAHTTGNFVIDATPPTITSVAPISTTALNVLFNEDVTQATAELVGNYTVDHSVGHPLTATRDATNHALVHLTFNTLANNSYVLTANGVQDLSGNACVNVTGTFSIGTSALPGDVVINEIMYDATSTPGDSEWVELHNRTAAAVNVGGWILTDAGTYPPTGSEGAIQIPQGTSIPAHGYIVVGRSALTGLPNYVQCNQYFNNWALGNSGDNLALYTDSLGGTLIDGSLTQNYPDLAPTNSGYSIEKCYENTAWSDTATWHVSTNAFAESGLYIRCTPGAQNSECVVENVPPTLVSVSVISGTILEVTFSEDVDATTSQVATNYSVNNGIGSPTSAVRQVTNSLVRLTFASTLPSNNYLLTVNNVQDLAGNAILANSQIAFAVAPQAPQLIFTEIMPNPNFPGTADSLGEWFEVYNPNAAAINLNGWIITDGAGSDTIEGDVMINSGQYFVFCSNGDSATNGGVPENYAYHFATSGNGISLSNSGDSIAIMNPVGQLSAGLRYTVNFGFSEGHSCQLRDLSYPMAIDTCWCRCDSIWAGATQLDHGTPRHATICAPVYPVQFYTTCDIRDEDACGIPSLVNRRVITQGIVTSVDSCRGSAYIESNNCAVEVYGAAVRDTMENIGRIMQKGDLVEVNGYVTHYYGLTEIATYNSVVPAVTLLSAGHTTPAPVVLSASVIQKNSTVCTAEPQESRFIRLLDMTFIHTAADTFAAGSFYAFSGVDTVQFYVNACDAIVGDSIPYGLVPITGILSQHIATACRCGGYEIVPGDDHPLASVVCAQPTGLTVYRDAPNNTVTLRWLPGVNQTCNCYEVYWTADATAVFPAGYTLLSTVVGATQYTDTDALSVKRFYVVRAGGASCP